MRISSTVKNNHSIKPAFTIVELLIVIVVIGILAALVFVSYSSIQTKAQNASAIADLSQNSTRFLSYSSTATSQLFTT